jgi:hypothetical protein
MNKKNIKGQSEMVGFALIIIIVAVVLLIFLSVSFKNSNNKDIQSFEVESYLQSTLEYTTDCSKNYETDYYNLRRLIFACVDKKDCFDGSYSCEILNNTLKNLLSNSWEIGEDSPNKGYSLEISVKGEEFLSLEEGNFTNNNKGAFQSFEDGLEIRFIVYN